MSLITDDPDESPRDCSTSRNSWKHHHHHLHTSRGRRRALIAASSAVASLLSLAFILWLILRPSSPRFYLLAATATATDPNATALLITAAFTARNPNARATALYDRLHVQVQASGVPLAAAVRLPPFDQPQGDVVLSASLTLPAAVAAAGGRALLRLRIEGQLRWKVAACVSARHALSVDCVAVMLLQPSPPSQQPSSNSQSQSQIVGVVQGMGSQSQCPTTLHRLPAGSQRDKGALFISHDTKGLTALTMSGGSP